MSNIAALEVELDLDSGQFTGKLTQAGRAIQVFGRQIDGQARSIQNIERRVTSLTGRLRDTMVILGQFRGAMHTVWGAAGAPVAGIIKVNAELERMQALMSGVAKGTAEQRKAQAGQDFNFALDLAKNAPFQVGELANAMVKFRSAGIDPTTGSMQALTDAVAAFGGTDQTLHRATIAIQQMAGKGVISMEELRQQLGEAVPSAMQLLARGAGMEMGDLVKEISKGTVEANTALKILFAEMKREYDGSGEKMMTTWNGLVSRMKTEWFLFAKNIGDAGLFDAAKQAVTQLSQALTDPKNIQMAVQFGQALGELVAKLADSLNWIIQNREEIVIWGKALAAIVAGRYIMSILSPLNNLVLSVGGTTQAMKLGTTATLNYIKALRGMTMLQMLTGLVTGFGTAVRALLGLMAGAMGPIGVLVGGLSLVAAWMIKVRGDASQAEAAIKRVMGLKDGELLSDEDIASVADKTEQMEGNLRRLQNLGRGDRAADGVNNRRSAFMRLAKDLGLEELEKDILHRRVSLTSAYDQLHSTITGNAQKLKEGLQRHQATVRENSLTTAVEEDMKGYRSALDERLAIFEEHRARILASENLTNEAKRNLLLKNDENRMQAHADFANEQLATITAEILASRNGKEGMTEQLQRTQAAIKQEWMDAQQALVEFRQTPSELKLLSPSGGKDEKANKLSPYQSAVGQLEGRIAQLQAKIAGGIGGVERMEARIDAGLYGKMTEGEERNLTGLQQKADELQKILDGYKAKIAAAKEATESFGDLEAKVFADAESARQRLESGNFYDQQSAGMIGLERTLAVVKQRLMEAGQWTDEWAEKFGKVREAVRTVDVAQFVEEMRQAADEDRIAAIANPRLRALAEFQLELDEIARKLNLLRDKDGIAPKEAEDAARDAVAAANARFAQENKTEFAKLLDDWEDLGAAMDRVWTDAISGFSDTLADAIVSGKADFSDLINHMLKEIVRANLNKGIANVAGAFASGGGGWSSLFQASGWGFENGGIQTSYGPLPLRAYEKGGIARGPQLTLFGEGRMPEAYVPLPDGRTIPVTMKGGGGGGGGQVVNNTEIAVHIASDGSARSQSSSDGQREGRELAKMIEGTVRDVINKESRQGGIIWRQKYGS